MIFASSGKRACRRSARLMRIRFPRVRNISRPSALESATIKSPAIVIVYAQISLLFYWTLWDVHSNVIPKQSAPVCLRQVHAIFIFSLPLTVSLTPRINLHLYLCFFFFIACCCQRRRGDKMKMWKLAN